VALHAQQHGATRVPGGGGGPLASLVGRSATIRGLFQHRAGGAGIQDVEEAQHGHELHLLAEGDLVIEAQIHVGVAGGASLVADFPVLGDGIAVVSKQLIVYGWRAAGAVIPKAIGHAALPEEIEARVQGVLGDLEGVGSIDLHGVGAIQGKLLKGVVEIYGAVKGIT